MNLVPLKKHSLTRAQFEQLADIPPEAGMTGELVKSRSTSNAV